MPQVNTKMSPPEDVERARIMYESGASWVDMGNAIKRYPNTIRSWAYEWDHEKRNAALAAQKRTAHDLKREREAERMRGVRSKKKAAEQEAKADGSPYDICLKRVMSSDYGLYQYQREFLVDKSRFKCVLKSRQIGFSYVMALGVVLGLLRGKDQLIVSASEDQALIIHEHMVAHLDRLGIVPVAMDANSITLEHSVAKFFSANFRTIQGRAGDVWLDEFAWHIPSHQKRIWGAIAPSITAVGGNITVVSTPFVPDSFHWRLMQNHNNEWPQFKRWRITIHDAMAGGMKVPGGLEELRSLFDAENWAMFYLCQYAEGTDALLNWNLLSASTGEVSNVECDYSHGGVDIGRTSHRFAVAVVGKVAGKDMYVLKHWDVKKGLTFAKQEREVLDWDSKVEIRRWCVDRTGLGMDIAERLSESLSPRCVGIHFDAKKKERMALKMLKLFEDKKIIIPNSADVMANLHSVKKVVSGTGVRYEATSDDSGHGDLFWAVAMAIDSMVTNYGSGRARVELWN